MGKPITALQRSATILRQDPLFEFKLTPKGFEIFNEANPNDNGQYVFGKVESIRLDKKNVNRFVSILSLAVDLFSGTGTGGIFKEKNQLTMRYDSLEKQILMDHCDMKAAEDIVQKIKGNTNTQKKY